MHLLEDILLSEIRKTGVISFARFMELALYCPNSGYYERIPHPVGHKGDFYTNVSVGPLFGELLALQVAEWLQTIDGAVHCVEAGAGDGQLAFDILGWLAQHRPNLLERLQYWVLEPSPARQSLQRTKLEKFAHLACWAGSFDSGPADGVSGVILSNELLDSFPTHRLGWDAPSKKWFEWGVAAEGSQLVWVRMLDRDWNVELKRAGVCWPEEVLAVLPPGYTIEFCPAATDWWTRAARLLNRGWLLTIDYGLTDTEFLSPSRTTGTLRGYYRHHVTSDLLARPGGQDLTAHVHFSELQFAGESAGLRTDGLHSQSSWLTAIAARMERELPLAAWPAERRRQLQTLIHPELMGRAFRVLVQRR